MVYLFLIFSANSLLAQTTPDPVPFKPIIGLGTGMFSFYGEASGQKFANPLQSRIGYELSISKNLNSYLNVRFNVLHGKISANDRFAAANLTFESSITAGGVNLSYNFKNLLPENTKISPYITAGFETFEFLSKGDLFDKFGNRYHYWSDGSLRNLPESSADAGKSIVLTRDYIYESDLREANLDGFGKFAERSFAIPVGAGVTFHLTEKLDFKVGTTVHFTMTDYLDAVTSQSIGSRAGNKQNDRFMMTSFSIHYDFGTPVDQIEDAMDEEFLALDSDDEDEDGVNDYKDKSPFTPIGESVDTAGVPIDTDNDRVFNYQDKEINSPEGAVVTADGIALTDSLMEIAWLTYTDSTGEYSRKVILDPTEVPGRDVYVVQLGAYKTGVPQDLLNKFLSIPDIKTTLTADSVTVYTVGRFYSFAEAEKLQQKFLQDSIPDAVVALHKNNEFTKVDGPVSGVQETLAAKGALEEPTDTTSTPSKTITETEKPEKAITEEVSTTEEKALAGEKGVVYRIQIGAYKRKVSKQIFQGVPELVTVTGANGVTKYLSGNFTDYKDAAKRKVDMLEKGFEGAFIVAFKEGGRVTLESTGVDIAPKDDVIEPEDATNNAIKKELIVFKVQVGVFRSEVPGDIKEKLKQLPAVESERTPEGLTRYTSGTYSDYASAVAAKNEAVKNGIEGAFVIAFFNERLIDVQEAIELLKN